MRQLLAAFAGLALTFFLGLPGGATAAEAFVTKESDWVARDFRFHTGEVLPELRIHYTTVGAPTGDPVLVLHYHALTLLALERCVVE